MRPTAGSMSSRRCEPHWWPAALTTPTACGAISRRPRRWSTNCAAREDSPTNRASVRKPIFQFMHERVLHGGYDLAYTDLRRVLDEGRFNCVSATVLFNYLAGQLGLDCHGLEMPGHAMSRVSLPDGMLDVENTCPRWFCLQRRSAAAGGRRRRRRSARRPRPIARRPAQVSPIQLAAMIYYNRGVDLLGEKRFAEAARANAKALRLDPKTPRPGATCWPP